MEKLAIKNRKQIILDVKKTGFFSKGIGLMFRQQNTENLLFEFKKDVLISIHSFFVFFPFLALWLDSKNNIIKRKIIMPFCLSARPKKPFRKLIEIPFNERNRKIIRNLMKNSKNSSEKWKDLNIND